jgi:peptide chain release factor subunit 1
MPDIDRKFLRKLAEWSSDGAPVSSLYIDVDGRRFPRKQDYMMRGAELCHRLREQASQLERSARRSVDGDADRFDRFLDRLDRGRTRGVALFSSAASGLWEEVTVSRPLPDRVSLGSHPHVLPLEALVETYESFCTVLVDREKARIFLAYVGSISDETGILDEVPGQHDQGGWSQARYQRHIEEHVLRHFKHVAQVMLAFHRRRGFDRLILAGTEEVLAGFEDTLHDYLKQRIVARLNLPMTATQQEVLDRSLEVEERVEQDREREILGRVEAEAAAGRGAARGLTAVLSALNEGRVDTLVVPFGLSESGVRCTGCGRLWSDGRVCEVCSEPTEAVADIIEEAVAAAMRQSARVETLTAAGIPGGHAGLGVLLRY